MQASIIVFLLALVIATGVCLTAAFGGRYAIQDLVRHSNLAFQQPVRQLSLRMMQRQRSPEQPYFVSEQTGA